MPGQIYARWVPPTPPATQVEFSSASAIPATHLTPKKEKKLKRHRDSDTGPGVVPIDAAEGTSRPAAKKERKRKREAQPINDVDHVETTPKKHRAILSKFEKVARRVEAKEAEEDVAADATTDELVEKSAAVLRDLEPLPQPAPVADPAFEPTFSVLPTWLAHPVIVDSSTCMPFDELGVQPFFLKKLQKQGFSNALAVQSALLPMLQPGHDQHFGDICVSAKTGSGKTLAYLLPIIESLKEHVTPVLSAIIVVPSRKLVDQALQIAEELCAGTKIRVGTATGNIPFAIEQKQLVKLRPHYDPERASQARYMASQELETGFVQHSEVTEDLMTMPVDHVPRYDSAIDILICTPGRLVEHIESTTGLLLRSVRWLVIDEADQLLNQNFQGWATVLMDTLHGNTPDYLKDAQERIRSQRGTWVLPARRQITKVVLSATMETDLTKLGTLRLKRPRLVSVKGELDAGQPTRTDGDVFELPSTLDEFATSVRDGQKKPLYLLYWLLTHAFNNTDKEVAASTTDGETKTIAEHKSRVLVFTKTNESASRLSHLLSVLEPSLKEYMRTMTPTSTAKESKKLLRSFGSGAVKILIASDAASRGLDIPNISHVISYDMPSSVTSYVHRVGRTARANKDGEAWTLFTKTEAAWFWNQIAKGVSIRRGGKAVKRVDFKEWNVTYNRKRTYDAALAELQEAVEGTEAAE